MFGKQCQDKESSKLIQLLQPCASQHSEFFSIKLISWTACLTVTQLKFLNKGLQRVLITWILYYYQDLCIFQQIKKCLTFLGGFFTWFSAKKFKHEWSFIFCSGACFVTDTSFVSGVTNMGDEKVSDVLRKVV